MRMSPKAYWRRREERDFVEEPLGGTRSTALLAARQRAMTHDDCRAMPAPGSDEAYFDDPPDGFEPERRERTLRIDEEISRG